MAAGHPWTRTTRAEGDAAGRAADSRLRGRALYGSVHELCRGEQADGLPHRSSRSLLNGLSGRRGPPLGFDTATLQHGERPAMPVSRIAFIIGDTASIIMGRCHTPVLAPATRARAASQRRSSAMPVRKEKPWPTPSLLPPKFRRSTPGSRPPPSPPPAAMSPPSTG